MVDYLHTNVLKDEDLARYVLDQDPLPLEVTQHVDQCSQCKQRLVHYQSLNTLLLKRFYRSTCPSTTRLSLYCSGRLSMDEVMQISSHLQLCPICAREVLEVRQLLLEMTNANDEEERIM